MIEAAHLYDQPPWYYASLAACLFAIDPIGLGGICIRGRHGPVRDIWLQQTTALLPKAVPLRKLALGASESSLFGAIDLTATLASGTPIFQKGLLSAINGGCLIISSAERLSTMLATRLGQIIDTKQMNIHGDSGSAVETIRFAGMALDESIDDDEIVPATLADRLALMIDINEVHWKEATPFNMDRDAIEEAKARLSSIAISDDMIAALCATALRLGVMSLRPSFHAMNTARAMAAYSNRQDVTSEDIAVASLFVLAPRATVIPQAREQNDDQRNDPAPDGQDSASNDSKNDTDDERAIDEMTNIILEAVKQALPDKLLNQQSTKTKMRPKKLTAIGKAGQEIAGGVRGRPIGTRRADLKSSNHLDMIETLKAAAPWQKLRRSEISLTAPSNGTVRPYTPFIYIRSSDFRVKRLKAKMQTATIFVVDASGSTALQRLAEAKGAVELLLADCYIRRDQVALITFRGKRAELVLPPTRSLVRAKRSLAGMAGGGGTPLATAITEATSLAHAVKRKGLQPMLLFLSDAKANIAIDGTASRDQAKQDAIMASQQLRALDFATIFVDTSPRPQIIARNLAEEMGAKYMPLPYADAMSLSAAAKAVTRS